MLWELSVSEQRYRAVLEVGAGIPVTEVADRYGVSPRACHVAARYRCERHAGLEDRSHRVMPSMADWRRDGGSGV